MLIQALILDVYTYKNESSEDRYPINQWSATDKARMTVKQESENY